MELKCANDNQYLMKNMEVSIQEFFRLYNTFIEFLAYVMLTLLQKKVHLLLASVSYQKGRGGACGQTLFS